MAYLKEHRRSGAGTADVATVPVDDLRPRVRNVELTLDAVFDIRFCEHLFDNWMAELDKCVANHFSRPHIPCDDNTGSTESRMTPTSETIGRKY